MKGKGKKKIEINETPDLSVESNEEIAEPTKDEVKKEAPKKKTPKDEIAELNDKLLRLQADFDNYRKRIIREKSDLYTRANEEMMEELLSVLDHFDFALAAIDEHKEQDAFVDGVKLVSSQLLTVLKKFGLETIDAESGEFDHNHHEAISHLASEELAEDMIISQVRKGYLYGGKLLRAAQVVVSKGSEE